MSHPIVLACDVGYAMPLTITLRSIVETKKSDRPVEFHILSEGFTEDTRKKVFDSLPLGSASIRWVPVDASHFQGFITMNYISKMTFARLIIPQIFSDTVSRVLYLDADIMVLDDLTELWEMNLEGAAIGAVPDLLDRLLKSGSEEDLLKVPRLKDVPRVRNYFNAGVLIIDLVQWRKEEISEKSLKFLAKHPTTPFSDQDALNVACDGLWKQLKPIWNFQDHRKTKISDMSFDARPVIVHFVTSLKPWKPSSMSLNARLYDSVRNRTCFARTPLNKLEEFMQNLWYRLKRVFSRYRYLRTIWNIVQYRKF